MALTMRPMIGCLQPAQMIAAVGSILAGVRKSGEDRDGPGREIEGISGSSEETEMTGSPANAMALRGDSTSWGSTMMGGMLMVGTVIDKALMLRSSPPSLLSLTVDGCRRGTPLAMPPGMPLSKLLLLLTTTGGLGSGRLPNRSRDLIEEIVSDLSMVAWMGEGVRMAGETGDGGIEGVGRGRGRAGFVTTGCGRDRVR